jgi:hypothetical protein
MDLVETGNESPDPVIVLKRKNKALEKQNQILAQQERERQLKEA